MHSVCLYLPLACGAGASLGDAMIVSYKGHYRACFLGSHVRYRQNSGCLYPGRFASKISFMATCSDGTSQGSLKTSSVVVRVRAPPGRDRCLYNTSTFATPCLLLRERDEGRRRAWRRWQPRWMWVKILSEFERDTALSRAANSNLFSVCEFMAMKSFWETVEVAFRRRLVLQTSPHK